CVSKLNEIQIVSAICAQCVGRKDSVETRECGVKQLFVDVICFVHAKQCSGYTSRRFDVQTILFDQSTHQLRVSAVWMKKL
ncbi:hypothetical protein, partial [Shewanella sp.]|uniref:hypothetical protein n=1 Tax=Shewanella sp. TaxID=50422 RepID=UPI004048524E